MSQWRQLPCLPDIRGRLRVLSCRNRRDKGVSVDLAVRVGERYTDNLALVLEDKDVVHEVPGAELHVAVGPHVNQVFDVLFIHLGQRGVVIVGVEDDLADSPARRSRGEFGSGLLNLRRFGDEGRELVLEDDYLVGGPGDFGWEVILALRWAERTVFRRWMERAVLAVGGVGDPLFNRRVPAEFVHSPSSLLGFVLEMVEDDVAAVVLCLLFLLHCRAFSFLYCWAAVWKAHTTAVSTRQKPPASSGLRSYMPICHRYSLMGFLAHGKINLPG